MLIGIKEMLDQLRYFGMCVGGTLIGSFPEDVTTMYYGGLGVNGN